MDDTGFLSLLLYDVFIYSDHPWCDSSLVYLTSASVVVAPYTSGEKEARTTLALLGLNFSRKTGTV